MKKQIYPSKLELEIRKNKYIPRQINKRERLIQDEVNANNDYIQINLDLMYDMRLKFCEEVNAMFGTNIKVEKRKVEDVYSNVKRDDQE